MLNVEQIDKMIPFAMETKQNVLMKKISLLYASRGEGQGPTADMPPGLSA